ncbi:MAG: DUF4136 domain-containing protein [Desulfocapsaceae bacterium]|nr:DUF4136 domain-containing protein [Desulfocapsaceae bacterium]
MNRFTTSVSLLLLLFLTGCAGIQVSEDYDTRTPFPKLQFYDWNPIAIDDRDTRLNNPLLQKRFREAIDRELQTKGFVVAPIPDFRVQYTYSIATRLESDPVSTGFGFGKGSYRRYGGIGISTRSDIRQYDVGTLVIDIYDEQSAKLLWRGRGSDTYDNHATPEEMTVRVNKLVAAVLAQFPPGR